MSCRVCLLSVKMYNARGFSLGSGRGGKREGGGKERGKGEERERKGEERERKGED